MTDLDLAKIQGKLYQDFVRIQGNLIAVNQEIETRGVIMDTAIKDKKKKK